MALKGRLQWDQDQMFDGKNPKKTILRDYPFKGLAYTGDLMLFMCRPKMGNDHVKEIGVLTYLGAVVLTQPGAVVNNQPVAVVST